MINQRSKPVNRRCSTVSIGFLALSLLLGNQAFSQTEVSGEVSGVWDVNGSPYIAVDSILVPEGERLIIEPGVEVRFDGHFPFLVYGTLLVVGTEEDSIFFMSNRPEDEIRWGSIRFLSAGDESIIDYVHIEGSFTEGQWPHSAGGAIYIERCAPTVRRSLITGCEGYRGVICIYQGLEPLIEDCVIADNLSGGISCYGVDYPLIVGNNIRENGGEYGIYVYRAQRAIIRDNNIIGNDCVGIHVMMNNLSVIDNNTISGNSSSGILFDAYNSSSYKAVIRNNHISGSEQDGGLRINRGGEAIIAGNIFLNNIPDREGGAALRIGGEVQGIHIYNCVFYGNGDGGISFPHERPISIRNCIFWNNRGEEITRRANVEYCVVEGGYDGRGIIDEDPGFVDPDAGDFRLREDSPCINRGDRFPMYNDADGSRNDIGAYGGNDLLFGFETSIEFPTIGHFCYAHDRFVLCNMNQDALMLHRLELDNPDNFTVLREAPIELPPNEWVEFPLDFNPIEAGEHEATLTFSIEDYEPWDEASVMLSGEALDGFFREVSGVWTREMSPIHVIGNIFVSRYDTLFIEPGVEVRFDPDTRLSSISTRRTLIAAGSDEDSILFTSALEDPEPGSWDRLIVNGRIEYCVIEFAEWGVWLDGGRVEHSTIRNCDRGILIQPFQQDEGVVSHCWVENCDLGVAVDPVGVLEFSVIINCRDAIEPEDGGYAYHNLFAYNDEVELAYTYWIQEGWDEWEIYSYLRTEGNIFYRNNTLRNDDRPHWHFIHNSVFESEVYGDPLIGELNQENLNGTPCDENFNITEDPLLVDPEEFNFHLQGDSPCIDAGNPLWRRNPDGSWADLGPLPFDHDEADPVIIVEPQSIRAEGSSEHFINISNGGEGRLWWRASVDSVDAEWVSFDPQNGVLHFGSDSDIFVTLDVDDFDPGVHEAILIINSNDPENPDFEINITVGSNGVDDNNPSSIPDKFSIISTYPNPFNSSTTITYGLPVNAVVELSLFDLSGRVVATLESGRYPAGWHRTVIDASGLATGLYFIRMEAGDFRSTRRVLLVR